MYKQNTLNIYFYKIFIKTLNLIAQLIIRQINKTNKLIFNNEIYLEIFKVDLKLISNEQ